MQQVELMPVVTTDHVRVTSADWTLNDVTKLAGVTTRPASPSIIVRVIKTPWPVIADQFSGEVSA